MCWGGGGGLELVEIMNLEDLFFMHFRALCGTPPPPLNHDNGPRQTTNQERQSVTSVSWELGLWIIRKEAAG